MTARKGLPMCTSWMSDKPKYDPQSVKLTINGREYVPFSSIEIDWGKEEIVEAELVYYDELDEALLPPPRPVVLSTFIDKFKSEYTSSLSCG